MVENPKLEAQLRYKFPSHNFLNAYKPATSLKFCSLLGNALDCFCTQLDENLNVSSSAMNDEKQQMTKRMLTQMWTKEMIYLMLQS
jgi:hypothetical protein